MKSAHDILKLQAPVVYYSVVCDIFALDSHRKGTWWYEVVHALKQEHATTAAVEQVGGYLQGVLSNLNIQQGVICPIPGRAPDSRYAMAPIARQVARVMPDVRCACEGLVRTRAAEKVEAGCKKAGRSRWSATVHANTYRFTVALEKKEQLILLDDVTTTGGTMLGAIRHVQEALDGHCSVLPLTLTAGGQFGRGINLKEGYPVKEETEGIH